MSNRTVLVTGATGFIGRHVLDPLIARGFDVHGTSRQRRAWPDAYIHGVDLLKRGAAERFVAGLRATHLLHLAWDVTPGSYWNATENLTWVEATLRLYRAFAEAGGQRIVVAGTCAEYDWSFAELDETATPRRPATLYGVAKNALHDILAHAARADRIALSWARIFFVYGPGEHPDRLVPSVIVPLLANRPALLGDGCAARDFLHVADVAAALGAILDSEHVGPINVCSGISKTVRDVAAAVGAELGRADLLHFGARPTPAGEAPRLAGRLSGLAHLGFAPRFSLRDGLADSIAWWRKMVSENEQPSRDGGDIGGGAKYFSSPARLLSEVS